MFTITGTGNKFLTNPTALPIIQVASRQSLRLAEITYKPISKPSTATQVTPTTPIQEGTPITVPAPTSTSVVVSAVIGGQKYTSVPTSALLTPGTFYHNPIDNTITILPYQGSYYPPNFPIQIYGSALQSRSDIVTDIPGFIRQYAIEGTVSITRAFNSHPTTSLNLIVDYSKIHEVRTIFQNHDTKWIMYNIPFRAQNYSETIFSRTTHPFGLYQVSISFEGWWVKLLNKKIPIRGNAFSTAVDRFTSPACTYAGKPTGSTPEIPAGKNKFKVALSTLAQRAGITYLGDDHYAEFSNDTPAGAATTFAEQFEPILSAYGLYALYSDASAIRTRHWDTPPAAVPLGAEEIIETVNLSTNTEPFTVPPTTLTWRGKFNDLSEEDKYNKRPLFKVLDFPKRTVVGGDPNPASPPPDLKRIQTMSLNFDSSGQRHVKTITHYEGDTIVREETIQYSYAYLGIDVLKGDSINASGAGHWVEIERTRIDHIYDELTGYFLGTDTSGTKLGRFDVESDQLETVFLKAESATSPDAGAELNAFKFKNIAVRGQKRVVLVQYRDVFRDVVPLEDQVLFYEECSPSGKLMRVAIADPRFTEPRFVAEEEDYFNCFAWIPNPLNRTVDTANGDPLFPPKTTGEERRIRTRVAIYQSQNTLFNVPPGVEDYFISSLGESVAGEDFVASDRYKTYTKTQSAQDASFQNSREETQTTENSGRPPQALKRPTKYVLKADAPESSNGYTITLSTTKTEKKPLKDPNTYTLFTAPYTGYEPPEGSLDFAVETYDEALRAAKNQIQMQSVQQRGSISLTTFFNPYLEEGSRIDFDFAVEHFSGRILSNTSQFTILGHDYGGELRAKGLTQLTMGKDTSKEIQVLKEPENKNTQKLTIPLTYYRGKILGELVRFTGTSRGNF
jgi:hypothetical protein